ncbi:MAG: PKD domain-containing protein [Ginsengibacter sp.]
MKKLVFISFLSFLCLASLADHLKGGWIYYEYLGIGSSANTSKYKITVKQYMRCTASGGQLDQEVYLGIFNGSTYQLIQTDTLVLAGTVIEQKSDFSCIVNPPTVCYRIDEYTEVIDLPDNIDGYIISVQRCCRISGIVNVTNSSAVGLTYTNTIPGIINAQSYRNNSSAVFAQKDTVILCHNSPFTLDFNATDPDGDSLSYSFTEGLTGGDNSLLGARPNPPDLPAPPYFPNAVIPYFAGYSGSSPLGLDVTIDPVTGIISGNAPGTIGTYVVAVDAKEYRGGVLINSTRKEIHMDVGNCDLTAAQLNPTYYVCDSYTYTFQNEGSAPAGSFYSWNFGDIATGANNISSSPTPTHIFSDTGIYNINLKIASNVGCQDSATAIVKVYPGFFPGFITTGQCKKTPIQFTDTTKTAYGVVNAWSWNFGDLTTLADTSHRQDTVYTYSSSGNYDVTFYVANSKGCLDTIVKTVIIKDKPDFTVTNDTLICPIDTLQLNATGNGTAFWTPNYNLNNQNTLSPLVSPDVPTTYYVIFADAFGCQAFDSVFVDVKQYVTLDAGADTGICEGSTIRLNTVSDALHYTWSPSMGLDDATVKNPMASPQVTTTFYVIGNIGKCQSTDSIKVMVSPYPVASAKIDTAICYSDSIQLNVTGGIIYSWSPVFFLSNAHISNPVAKPIASIVYIVTINDTLGCPLPVYDTIIIQVQNAIADAGPRDTTIVANQPLQLNATGGQIYLWTPSTGLNNPAIANPVAIVSSNIDYAVTASTSAGCTARDTISVKVYQVPPGLYVPAAFTPNGDGLNDFFRPVSIGMKQITYFKVFNRWGVLVYSGNKRYYKEGDGWNGIYKGKVQDAAVYVWMAQGIDYRDNKITQKGIVTLIR